MSGPRIVNDNVFAATSTVCRALPVRSGCLRSCDVGHGTGRPRNLAPRAVIELADDPKRRIGCVAGARQSPSGF